ncbi:Cupredoxin, partial [Tuber magnatum]
MPIHTNASPVMFTNVMTLPVNGVPWPYLDVEPRKYRFRLLDGSPSRSYKITIEPSNGNEVPMAVVGTDSGFIEAPVTTDTMILGVAERYEIIVDFSSYAGQNLTMKNPRDFSRNEDYAKTNLVITAGNGLVPSSLVDLNFPTDTGIDRRFRFERSNGQWLVNSVGFADVNNRILAAPTQGSPEVWGLGNSSGGWAHPIHIHLVDFKVLTCTNRGVESYEAGFKDTVFLDEGEVATVIARFHPWAGQYMFHCHNTVHEDQDMMGVFDVNNTKANPSRGDQFSDPLNPAFAAKPYSGTTDLNQIRTTVLPVFANLDIYPSD